MAYRATDAAGNAVIQSIPVEVPLLQDGTSEPLVLFVGRMVVQKGPDILVRTMPSVLRYALRQLLKSPGFTLVAVVGLALGIGANVALFSVVNSVLLRPLPYHEPDRLVRIASTNQENNLTRVGFSYTRFLEVQQRQQVFSDLAFSAGNAFTLTGRGDPEQLIGLYASATLLPTLGLEPVLGRNFSATEDRPGGGHVALVSHGIWQQRFNRDPSILGQALTLDGRIP